MVAETIIVEPGFNPSINPYSPSTTSLTCCPLSTMIKTASELAEIIVSVGLAQNLAALRALATEGIQRGHMSLHARQVAIAAGASGEMVEQVAAQMVAEKVVRIDRAEEILREYKND